MKTEQLSSSMLEAEDRSSRMRAGLVATATGRSRPDVLRSLMVGEVVGLPASFDRNDAARFRAKPAGLTFLQPTSTPYQEHLAREALIAQIDDTWRKRLMVQR